VVLALLTSLPGLASASAASETWLPLGEGLDGDVYALVLDSSGNLYAGGNFTSAGGTTANYIAKWDGSTWSPLGSGMNNTVYALALDGSGNLYAGGKFTTAGGTAANRVAKWNGTSWEALGGGLTSASAEVDALSFDSSGNLYAGGSFTSPANRIAVWNGTLWSSVGGGAGGKVNALLFDAHGNLYIGGSFTEVGGSVSASHIAKWDGSAWSSLGGGTSNTVRALAIGSDGSLYVGGSFVTTDGTTVNRIAKWNSNSWSALGSGMNADVLALKVSDSGELYAGGKFASAGGVTMNNITRWDGTSWSALDGGVNSDVNALAESADGKFYAGGAFTTAGGMTANRVTRWAAPLPGVALATSDSLFCTGESASVTISLSNVTDLFGYQFVVQYNPDLASASAGFADTFFDTSRDAIVPPEWDASCSEGECKFAVSKVEPGEPVSGSGVVAQITLTGLEAGTFDLTIGDDILSDRDAQPMDHETNSLSLTVCGYASISGSVSLQGRLTPVNAGQIMLTDLSGNFGPYTTGFDPATGAFTLDNVKVMPEGSDYQFDATHGLYLGNRTTHAFQPLDSFTAPDTRLLGGDANNDGRIDLSDLTCVGGSFGAAPAVCGTTGSSDLNADSAVNILDLVLPGGNYGLTAPLAW